jgi:hypothetical protein
MNPHWSNLLPLFMVMILNVSSQALQSPNAVNMEVCKPLVDIVGKSASLGDLGGNSSGELVEISALANNCGCQQRQSPSENYSRNRSRDSDQVGDDSGNLVVGQSKTNWHFALELLLLGFAGILVGCAICVAGWWLFIVRANAEVSHGNRERQPDAHSTHKQP